MKLIDMNEVARLICGIEGGKVNQNIAEVKNMLRSARKLCLSQNDAWYTLSAYLRYDKRDTLSRKKKAKV